MRISCASVSGQARSEVASSVEKMVPTGKAVRSFCSSGVTVTETKLSAQAGTLKFFIKVVFSMDGSLLNMDDDIWFGSVLCVYVTFFSL